MYHYLHAVGQPRVGFDRYVPVQLYIRMLLLPKYFMKQGNTLLRQSAITYYCTHEIITVCTYCIVWNSSLGI